MKKNRLLFILLIFSSLLQSCGDVKVAGDRNEVFESYNYIKDQNMISAFVSDPSVVHNWNLEGGNINKTCKNAYIEDVNPYKLIKKWGTYIGDFGSEIEYISSPIAFDGKVFYLSKNSELIALNLETGSLLFKKSLIKDEFEDVNNLSYGGIGADEKGNLFISLVNGSIVSVFVSDNDISVNWVQNINGVGASPIVYNNIVFVNTDKGSLYALNKENGNVLWVFDSIVEMVSIPKIGSVAVSDNKVFVTMQNLESYVLDINNGYVVGATSLIGKSYFSSPLSFVGSVSSPVVYDGIVLSGNTDNLISAVSYSSEMNKLWSLPFGIYATPCLNNDIVFIATSSNKVLSLNLKNGKVIWDVVLKNIDDSSYILGIVLVNNNLIINTNKGEVIFINSITGELVRRQRMADGFVSSMIVIGNNIITVDIDGNIINFALEKRK